MKCWLLLLGMLSSPLVWADEVRDSIVPADSLVRIHADSTNHTRVDSLLQYACTFLGRPYGNRGESTASFDCSGYVRHCYKQFGVDLPHGSTSQSLLCEKIPVAEVRPGDLLFFSGRKKSPTQIGHVAMVYAVENGQIIMIHATVQAGVIKESLEKSSYFVPRFIMAGRLKDGL